MLLTEIGMRSSMAGFTDRSLVDLGFVDAGFTTASVSLPQFGSRPQSMNASL
ncbi:MAG: hypothetical protein E6614_26945 [Bradyrhizobium sp.]|uniref:hypothetical protein n=1 Tax=Bradyrhizobium TaxID=374 RepID=UPI001AED8372|nr:MULTISPECIES: hypothetical protein [unclassified Bradyrhizobium]MDU0954136.1 hypothetical protein [Bradyrhizobium sp.]MDU1664904.1 hypothetical protein [Bradyrhizobium sp.]MDU1690362.1 hypothetical protein [Bradyrhizobium sp.]MDU3222474.1 hypothetical protein [Bradyrhizobium sp.]MDU6065877.1 hypothetical protein [Bradyrhizobium sp.]